MCHIEFYLQGIDVTTAICLLWDTVWTGTSWSYHYDDDQMSPFQYWIYYNTNCMAFADTKSNSKACQKNYRLVLNL